MKFKKSVLSLSGSALGRAVFVYLCSASRRSVCFHINAGVQGVVIVISYFREVFTARGVQESRDCRQCEIVKPLFVVDTTKKPR